MPDFHSIAYHVYSFFAVRVLSSQTVIGKNRLICVFSRMWGLYLKWPPACSDRSQHCRTLNHYSADKRLLTNCCWIMLSNMLNCILNVFLQGGPNKPLKNAEYIIVKDENHGECFLMLIVLYLLSLYHSWTEENKPSVLRIVGISLSFIWHVQFQFIS